MHTHCTCEHQLKHCPHCDIVYCEKCNKEWKKETYNSFTYTTPSPLCGGTTTPGSNCWVGGNSLL